MRKGDELLFYHSGAEKSVVGIAKVVRPAYHDPTAGNEDWSTVDLTPMRALKRPVSLHEIKREPSLKKIPLVRQSRLSVMPLSSKEFEIIVSIGV